MSPLLLTVAILLMLHEAVTRKPVPNAAERCESTPESTTERCESTPPPQLPSDPIQYILAILGKSEVSTDDIADAKRVAVEMSTLESVNQVNNTYGLRTELRKANPSLGFVQLIDDRKVLVGEGKVVVLNITDHTCRMVELNEGSTVVIVNPNHYMYDVTVSAYGDNSTVIVVGPGCNDKDFTNHVKVEAMLCESATTNVVMLDRDTDCHSFSYGDQHKVVTYGVKPE